MTIRKRNPYLPVMLAIFLFYIFIAFCIPYCHDDWDWGLDIGLEQFLNASLNSRYVGSFFVILMTRSEIIKTAVIALTMFFIPLLISQLCDEERSLAKYLAANVLMLIMPKLMWQQSIGWVSAFANYIIPVALSLYLIIMMERSIKERRGSFWLLLPLATILGLFIENLSVYAFMAFLVFTIIVALKTKRLNPFHIFMTLFSFLGCILMFSNSMYNTLLTSGRALGGIRALAIDIHSGFTIIVYEASKRFLAHIFPSIFYDYPSVTAAASLALIFAALRGKTRFSAVVVSAVTVALNVCICLGIKRGMLLWTIPIALFVCLLSLVLMSRRKLALQLFLLLSVPAFLFPLVATAELGPRLYFLPYIFLSALTIAALPPLEDNKRTLASLIPALGLICCIVFYGYIYTEIRCVTVDRAEAIESAIESGSNEVVMRKDIYDYWWGRSPSDNIRTGFFKEFFRIPEDMSVIFEQ